ncbi:MAG: hypothetical protein ACK4M9_06225 [Anaerobacillus sp.]|uniref:hypothetical protein n=1 Tax=Anaerobacillus sp. TaxID=1872506 RepID=UPI00391D3681
MKQYIFFCSTNKYNHQYKEYKIEANGMMDALEKASQMKQRLESETLSNIRFEFKGVVY